jgi:hypothetical protein
MVFWQLTIDANDPALLARFWAQALGYQPVPPTEPQTTWHAHYRARLGGKAAYADRLFDPAGLRPPIWFQQVPDSRASGFPQPTEVRPGSLALVRAAALAHRSRQKWLR